MTHPSNDRLDTYLWDPAAPPDAIVRRIERQLSPAAFDPAASPLPLKRAASPARRAPTTRWLRLMMAAAALILVTGVSLAAWRWTWPEGRSWSIAAAPTGGPEELPVGAPLLTPPYDPALIRIARIGTMRVAGGSALTLRSTSSNRHRLVLERGAVHVRIWAPPFSVAFETPAGEVFDMGCEFELTVTGDSTEVRVTSGWVQLENFSGEAVVPAGASSTMRDGRPPGVAVFDDAAAGFRDAVRNVEASGGEASLEQILALTRARDVLTLLQLVPRYAAGSPRLATRAFELSPPDNPADLQRVVEGDRAALDRWMSSLPLPSPKSGWWLNWRDALPFPGGEPSR